MSPCGLFPGSSMPLKQKSKLVLNFNILLISLEKFLIHLVTKTTAGKSRKKCQSLEHFPHLAEVKTEPERQVQKVGQGHQDRCREEWELKFRSLSSVPQQLDKEKKKNRTNKNPPLAQNNTSPYSQKQRTTWSISLVHLLLVSAIRQLRTHERYLSRGHVCALTVSKRLSL